MKNYIKSELLKFKRSMELKILIIVPILATILGVTMLTTGGDNLIMFAYNSWYLMLFPFLLAWISGSNIGKEKKYCYHAMFCVVRDKKKLWMGKLYTFLILLFGSSIILAVLLCISKLLVGCTYSFGTLIVAAIVLCITFAWQVPVSMMLAQKFNVYVAAVVSVIGNLVIETTISTKGIWWLPYGISSRLMCPIISTLPNGCSVSLEPALADSSVIAPGIFLSIVYFIIAMIVTKNMFNKEEL